MKALIVGGGIGGLAAAAADRTTRRGHPATSHALFERSITPAYTWAI